MRERQKVFERVLDGELRRSWNDFEYLRNAAKFSFWPGMVKKTR